MFRAPNFAHLFTFFALVIAQEDYIQDNKNPVEGNVIDFNYNQNLFNFERAKNALDFTGKVVLVTGSSAGIGAETVRLFSYLGASVVVTGWNVTGIRQVAYGAWQLSPNRLQVINGLGI